MMERNAQRFLKKEEDQKKHTAIFKKKRGIDRGMDGDRKKNARQFKNKIRQGRQSRKRNGWRQKKKCKGEIVKEEPATKAMMKKRRGRRKEGRKEEAKKKKKQ